MECTSKQYRPIGRIQHAEHYSADSCVLAALTSTSVCSIGIPTPGVFILEFTAGPMNTTRQLSNVMCDQLDLETLGFGPIMPTNLPGHWAGNNKF